MGKPKRFMSGLWLLALVLFYPVAVEARYVGGEPPFCCKCTPGRICSDIPGAGSALSLTEGNLGEVHSGGGTVMAGFGPTLSFVATYNSKQADGSQSRSDTVMGYGWTHSY